MCKETVKAGMERSIYVKRRERSAIGGLYLWSMMGSGRNGIVMQVRMSRGWERGSKGLYGRNRGTEDGREEGSGLMMDAGVLRGLNEDI